MMFRTDHIEAYTDENGNVPIVLRLEKNRMGVPVMELNIPAKTAEWLITKYASATPFVNMEIYLTEITSEANGESEVFENLKVGKARYDLDPERYTVLNALTELIPQNMPNFRVEWSDLND